MGAFDKTTTGACGIKTHWIDIIEEINEDNINSLYAGYLVLDYLIEKNDGDLVEAPKDYKGAKKNMKPVYKVLNFYEEIK